MSRATTRNELSRGLVLLAVLCAFSFGAIVKVAFAVDYHVTCVGHGFVSGGSLTDGSFFSRVDAGCGSTYRNCAIYTGGVFQGDQTVFDSGTTCNAWSNSFGTLTECASTAHVSDPAAFSDHVHLPSNWCG
jgi:hypothetical protein